MPFDNVVPIDAEAAQLLRRRHARLRWFVGALTATWLGVLVPILLLTPLPPLWPFVALAVLVVLAEHRFVLFGDETSMSASIIVIVASIFIFSSTSPIAGPMLIASFGGLYIPHIFRQQPVLLAANISIYALSAGVSSVVTSPIHSSTSVILEVFAALLSTATYWCANSVLTGSASATRNATSTVDAIATQLASEAGLTILTVAAALIAVDGALLQVVIPLAAFELGVCRTTAGQQPSGQWAHHLSLAAVVGCVSTTSVYIGGATGAALFAIGVYLSLSSLQVPPRGLLAAISCSWAFARLMHSIGLPGALALVSITLVLQVALTISALLHLHSPPRTRTRGVTLLGLMIPSRREVYSVLPLYGSAQMILWFADTHALFTSVMVVIFLPLASRLTRGAQRLTSSNLDEILWWRRPQGVVPASTQP